MMPENRQVLCLAVLLCIVLRCEDYSTESSCIQSFKNGVQSAIFNIGTRWVHSRAFESSGTSFKDQGIQLLKRVRRNSISSVMSNPLNRVSTCVSTKITIKPL